MPFVAAVLALPARLWLLLRLHRDLLQEGEPLHRVLLLGLILVVPKGVALPVVLLLPLPRSASASFGFVPLGSQHWLVVAVWC